MSFDDDEVPNIPRPARLPDASAIAAEAVPAAAAAAAEAGPRARPGKRSEALAAGALFMALLAVLTVAASVVTFTMF